MQFLVIAVISSISTIGTVKYIDSLIKPHNWAKYSLMASQIVSKLRSLKASVEMWLPINRKRVTFSGGQYIVDGKEGNTIDEYSSSSRGRDEILCYMENSYTYTTDLARNITSIEGGEYIITSLNDGKSWYAGYKFQDNDLDTKARERLVTRAQYLGLVSRDGATLFSKNDSEVYLFILNPSEVDAKPRGVKHDRRQKTR